MKKRKLKPWVKVAMAFILGVTIVSQLFKVIDSMASTEEIVANGVLHGVVESVGNGKANLTMIEIDLPFASVSVKSDKYYYSNGDVVTVVYDDGEITNSYPTVWEDEIEELRNNHGFMYRSLLEKHGKYISK